jgi:cytochrome c-type biogenesis protein CcmH
MMAELGPPPAELDPGDVELIERLREALAERPDDAEGHRLLAGSLGVMGRFAEARAAQSRVVEIRGENASAEELIDLAELMILAAGGYVSPEAEAVLRRALLLAPESPVARYYSGLTLLQAGRADLAYPIWSRLLEEGPSGAPWVAAIAPEIGEVARLAGRPVPEVPVPKGPGAADLEAAEALSPEDRSAMIEGMVAQLGARLAEQGGPPEEWAQLIRSLGVLGRTEEARAIWQEAQSSFADAPAAMAGIDAAARSAGLTP